MYAGQKNSARRPLTTPLAAAILSATLALHGALLTPAVAHAAESETSAPRSYAIAAGPLGAVLSRFAGEAGVVLSFDATLTNGKQSAGLQGRYSVDQGFAQLLAGSGLHSVRESGNGYSLVPAPKGDGLALAAATINGNALGDTTEGTGSYTTGSTRSALKLPLTIRQTPQSVTVITRQQMNDQGARDISDVLARTPGVSAQQYDSDRMEFSTRGFTITNYQYDGVNTLYDGVYDQGTTHTDMAVYDRVEVIKGATGLMTGLGDPSATVNLVRKRPTREFQASVTGTAGSWDNYRSEGDVSGSLNDDGTVRGRMVGVYQDRNSYLDHYSQKKDILYGILEADLTPDTLLTVGIDHQNNKPRGTSWTGDIAFYNDGTETDFSRSFNPGTDWSRRDFESTNFFGSLEQSLANDWKLKASLTHMINDHDTLLGSASGTTLAGLDPVTGEGAAFYWGHWEGHRVQDTVDVNASGPFTLFGREHELVVGYTAAAAKTTGDLYEGLGGDEVPGNLFDWNGNYPEPDFAKNGDYETNQRQNGAYLASRFKPADDLSIILGTRVSTFKYDDKSDFDVDPDTRTSYEQHGVVTPYAGVVYDLDETYSVYASYTSIYQPQTVKQASGNTLDPVEGASYEGGLKGEYLGGRLNASLALFRIEQDNVAQYVGTTLTGIDYYKPIKGATTKGIELEVAGELSEGWNLSAGYTYARTRDKDDQRIYGYPLSTTKPEHVARLFTSYRLTGDLNRLTIGGGLSWQSQFYGQAWGPYELKQGAYTLVDAMARYDFNEHVSASLNAKNLFDKEYLSGLGNFGTTYYGEPRSLSVSGTYTF
ncbi:TonB-dependent siderophore receptor [Pseudomonas turukhanskensis]|uniref:Ferripyoverdine receptor n=1 Tax=Pseudomonas turukhanskensis TaxID=1806536 RepID=A0A9W6K5E1_9PSED|nr:TonB-dependent receptor [Pseudomonas turukhanskensis]GLK87829.1 ferripyoverdine receptor [Pseudomonas turukhanskensis]